MFLGRRKQERARTPQEPSLLPFAGTLGSLAYCQLGRCTYVARGCRRVYGSNEQGCRLRGWRTTCARQARPHEEPPWARLRRSGRSGKCFNLPPLNLLYFNHVLINLFCAEPPNPWGHIRYSSDFSTCGLGKVAPWWHVSFRTYQGVYVRGHRLSLRCGCYRATYLPFYRRQVPLCFAGFAPATHGGGLGAAA